MPRVLRRMNSVFQKSFGSYQMNRGVGLSTLAQGEQQGRGLPGQRGQHQKNKGNKLKGRAPPNGLQQQSSSFATGAASSLSPVTETPLQDVMSPQRSLQMLSRYRALILDSAYRPIDVVNWQRAICMDLLEKADVLEYYDATISSVSEDFFLPAVMKARWYGGNIGRLGRVALNRRNIMLRDGLKCQYCGRKNDLTLDHVVPQSKGGPNTWENLVTACAPCNTRKGDSSLKKLRWKLLKTPKEPSPWELGIVLAGLGVGDINKIPDQWSNYLFSSGSEEDEE